MEVEKGKRYNVVGSSFRRTPIFTVGMANELRDNTQIGEEIEFLTDRFKTYEAVTVIGKNKLIRVIRSKVVKKYRHVFLLENGMTFSWTDYLLGKTSNQGLLAKPIKSYEIKEENNV